METANNKAPRIDVGIGMVEQPIARASDRAGTSPQPAACPTSWGSGGGSNAPFAVEPWAMPAWGLAALRAQLTRVNDVSVDADTEVEFIESDGSDSDTSMIGNNPLRSQAGNDRSESLQI